MIPKKTNEIKASAQGRKSKKSAEEKYIPTRNFTKDQMQNKLPPAEYDANGRPILNIDGIDDKNLGETMKDFFN